MATVETLETAQNIVVEAPEGVATIYEYTHAITGKKLYSIEHWTNRGCTLESGMCLCPMKIYDGYDMEWAEGYAPEEDNQPLQEPVMPDYPLRLNIPIQQLTINDWLYDAWVKDVHDGDTVTLKVDVGFGWGPHSMHIRFYGINSPELNTPEGQAALAHLQTLLKPNDQVVLESIKDKNDKYGGRYLGIIHRWDGKSIEATSINQQMVISGHAKPWDGVGIKPV